ncbi:MAG: AbrB/MazE/SpoVT family DNA-binding domain-containing protein [Candidatus Woesearchaeota archaeon]|nr:AbrB/MazE/SpoVT family DNA-binding domain-containing protein [Candidatus Woesearchaeota archaeon]
MKRKLVKQGNNALTITLPKEWLTRYGLNAGDEVFLKENDSDILIKAEPSAELKKVRFRLDSFKGIIQKYLQSLYRQGISEIELDYQDSSLLSEVHKTLNASLIGYEIIDHSQNKIIIKSVAEVQDGNFDAMFRRIFRVNLSMLHLLKKMLEESIFDEIESVMMLEETNNKLTNFCRRSISKRLYEGQEIVLLYSVIEVLERMADEIKYLISYFKSGKKPIIASNEKKLISDAVDFFELCHTSYFSDDFLSHVKEGIKRKDLIENSLKVFHKSTHKDFYIMHYFINIIQQTAHILTYRLQIYFLTNTTKK